MPLVILISLISVMIYYASSVRTRLEIIDNLRIISKDIIFKTKVFNHFKCQLSKENIADFNLDGVDIKIEVLDNGYKLSYDKEVISYILDES